MCTSLLFGQTGKKEGLKKCPTWMKNDSVELVSDESLIHQAYHGKPGQFVCENRWHY